MEIASHFFSELDHSPLALGFDVRLLLLLLLDLCFSFLFLVPFGCLFLVVLHVVLVRPNLLFHLQFELILDLFELLFKFAPHEFVILDGLDSILDRLLPDAAVNECLAKVTQVAEVDIEHVLLVEHVDVGLPLAWLVAECESLGLAQPVRRLHALRARSLQAAVTWGLWVTISAGRRVEQAVLLGLELQVEELKVSVVAGYFVRHGV